jgi:hypothetical protein
MSNPQEPNNASFVRFLGVAGCLLFLALAVTVGAESWHARSAGSPMTNWKGGTMNYQDGFKLTAALAVFGGMFGFFAVRPRTKQ